MAEINFVWTLGLEIVFRLFSQHHVTSDKSVLIRIEEKIDCLKLKLENEKENSSASFYLKSSSTLFSSS